MFTGKLSATYLFELDAWPEPRSFRLEIFRKPAAPSALRVLLYEWRLVRFEQGGVGETARGVQHDACTWAEAMELLPPEFDAWQRTRSATAALRKTLAALSALAERQTGRNPNWTPEALGLA